MIEHPVNQPGTALRFPADRLPGAPERRPSGPASRYTFALPLERYRALVVATEIRLGLPRGLLNALVAVESGYSASAVSSRGAVGLAQLMPATARSLGVSNSFDPLSNVDAGGRYLRGLLRRFGSITLALAAYNAGPSAIDRAGGLPPFRETRRYVTRVLATWSTSQLGGTIQQVASTTRGGEGPAS